MKKITFIFLILITAMLMSCARFMFEYHPTQYPMSKWEGDGCELYILDDRDLIIIDIGGEKVMYNVVWHGNCLWQLDTRDPLIPSSVVASEFENKNIDEIRGPCYEVTVKRKNKTILSLVDSRLLPKALIKDKISLVCVATNISDEDIPEIIKSPNYDKCPIYKCGSRWISNDQFILIEIVDQGLYDSVGKATFNNCSNGYIAFHEYNSCVVGGTDYTVDDINIDIETATEEYECTYYDDYFIATVVRSKYYEKGHMITFTQYP